MQRASHAAESRVEGAGPRLPSCPPSKASGRSGDTGLPARAAGEDTGPAGGAEGSWALKGSPGPQQQVQVHEQPASREGRGPPPLRPWV